MQIVTSHSLVPMGDEWQEIDAIATAPSHHPPLNWLWALHNEHRVVFYRLLLLADIHFFHGKHWISFWAMLAVQLIFLVVLAWVLHFCGVRGTMWRAVAGLAAFAFFCPSQWENFGWAFQISFLLPGLLLLLALAGPLKYERSLRQGRPQWVYIALSILAASAATYSNGNGVVLWPLLVLVALALVPRAEIVGLYIAFGILLIASYLYHYAGPTIHSSPMDSIRHPFLVSQFTAGYLGVIFPAWVKTRELIAVISGLIGLLIALTVTYKVLRRPTREPLQIVLLALLFFSVSTALITALGRIKFGLAGAFASRYQTYNLLFWFSAVSLLLLIFDEIDSPLRTVTLASISAAVLLSFVVFPWGIKASRTRTQQAEAAATALLSRVPDTEALAVLYVDTALVWRDAEYFREQHIFMFSDPQNDQLGQSFSSLYQVSTSQACQGESIVASRIPPENLLPGNHAGDLQISGVSDRAFHETNARFLLTANDRIIGFGAPIAGPFAAKHSEIVREQDAGSWLGFVASPLGIPSIDVYLDGNGGETACRLATVKIPASLVND